MEHRPRVHAREAGDDDVVKLPLEVGHIGMTRPSSHRLHKADMRHLRVVDQHLVRHVGRRVVHVVPTGVAGLGEEVGLTELRHRPTHLTSRHHIEGGSEQAIAQSEALTGLTSHSIHALVIEGGDWRDSGGGGRGEGEGRSTRDRRPQSIAGTEGEQREEAQGHPVHREGGTSPHPRRMAVGGEEERGSEMGAVE